MRWLCVLVVGCAADGSRAEWLPPPANAVAQCRYDRVPAEPYLATTITHFDARGLPIQYDGFDSGENTIYRASTILDYDDSGRLVRLAENEREERWAWSSATQVFYTAWHGATYRLELDGDGRVIERHGPLGTPSSESPPTLYEYDAGRLVRRSGSSKVTVIQGDETWEELRPFERRFFYDERGRVTSSELVDGFDEAPATVTYVDTGNQTRIEVTTSIVSNVGYTLTFDDQDRLSELAHNDGGVVSSYAYAPGVVEYTIVRPDGTTVYTGTGACPPPTRLLAPPPYRIEPPSHLYQRFYLFDSIDDLD